MYDIFHACADGITNISNTVILIMFSSVIAFCHHIRVILHVNDSVRQTFTTHAIKHGTHLKSSRAQSSSCHRYTCWFLC